MIEFKKILIPTDGSEQTKCAIYHGLELAKLLNAEVTAINVIDEPVYLSTPVDTEIVNLHKTLMDESKIAVEFVKKKGEERGVTVKINVVNGSPVKVIVDESANYDLIVMGSLGRTGISKLLVGSVAEKVVRLAKCPVMVVKMKEDQ